jgi:hypothetical protein
MRSPGYTPLFMHENVPTPISAPTRIRIGHPEKDLLHTSEQQRYSPEQMQCPESTANWRSRVEIRTAISLSSIVAKTIVNATIQEILYLLGGMCCIVLLRL